MLPSNLMHVILADLRYAIRTLRQSPLFFSSVIGILALGIGAGVSIFSLVDGVLLRPLPYKDPDRLVTLTSYGSKPPFESNGSLSYGDFQQFRSAGKSFTDLAVTFRDGWSRVALTGGSERIPIQGAFVSPNFFALFGRQPMLGRTFTSDEDARREHVVLISQALWSQLFAASPQVIGHDLEISHSRWRIIGVMPVEFQAPFLDTQIWAPISSQGYWTSKEEDFNPKEQPNWDVFGRVRPGVPLKRAQSEIDSLWGHMKLAHRADGNWPWPSNDIRVVPLREHFTGNVRKAMFVLFAAVAFLVLIACANVSNLLLARAARRQREIAIRATLGAGRARILQQLLTESLFYSLIAGILGIAAAYQLVPILKAFAPASTPLLDAVSVNERSLLFAFLLSVAVGVLLGFAPVSRVSRSKLNESLSAAGRSLTENRKTRYLKDALVAAEFALAMILLSGAGLLIRSFLAVLGVDPGFRPESKIVMEIGLPDTMPADKTPAFYKEIMRRVSTLPGVQSVGASGHLFYLDESRNHALKIVEGHAPEPTAAWKPLVWNQLAGDYFQAMGIPLLKGRFFNERDTAKTPPVAIVNETLARRYWPQEDPIGKRLKGFDPRGQHDDWLTVVGVVKDTRAGGLEKQPFSQIYEVQAQRTSERLDNVVVRTSGNPMNLANSLRAAVHEVDRNASVSSVATMDALLDRQTTQRRFQTWLVGVFSGLALALAALGVFGVMHYSVAARVNEIGIRMAVGAKSADIARLVLGNGTRLALLGILVGALCALLSARAIAGMLFAVKSTDPVTFLGSAVLLLVVALLATYAPAYRASRIDPMTALRQE